MFAGKNYCLKSTRRLLLKNKRRTNIQRRFLGVEFINPRIPIQRRDVQLNAPTLFHAACSVLTSHRADVFHYPKVLYPSMQRS